MGSEIFSLFYKASVGDLSLTVSMDAMFANTDQNLTRPYEERDLHFHTYYEIFFVGSEPLILQTAGETLRFSNCIAVTAPFTYHEVRERGSSRRFFFEMRKSAKTGVKNGVFEGMQEILSRDVTTLALDDGFFVYLDELAGCFDSASPIEQEKASALLKLIFIRLYEQNGGSKRSVARTAVENYRFVIDNIINSEYDKDVTLAYMADALHLSVRQTSRIIRSKYHMSLSELLREKRLRVAALLLQNTEKPVCEIAQELFLGAESYFFRLFREKFGVSPLAYRKMKKTSETT